MSTSVTEREGSLHLGQVEPVLATIERSVSQMAVGAALGSLRLQTIARRTEEVHRSAGQVGAAAEELNASIGEIAAATGQAAELAREVDGLTAGGQEESRQAAAAAAQVEGEIRAMSARFGSLVEQMSEVARVSKVIHEIARRTHLLALNAAIEAARAGQHGAGFAVVAAEVRKLAENTAQRTRQIDQLVGSIGAELEPVRLQMAGSVTAVTDAAHRVHNLGQTLQWIHGRSRQQLLHLEGVAAAAEEQTASVESVLAALQESVTPAVGELTRETEQVSRQLLHVSTLVEEAYGVLGDFPLETAFHRSLALARELADRGRAILEAPVDAGEVSLQSVLDLTYMEIKGAAIQSLARLFNVSRVPASGFIPPKFATGYDHLVDRPLMSLYDELMQRDNRFVVPLLLDLNAYAPVHNSQMCSDWTGQPDYDLAHNRVKRFMHGMRVMLRAARVGLERSAGHLPDRAGRRQFEGAGCNLREPAGGDPVYQVFTYASDLGSVGTAVAVPVYVKGHRWGCALVLWNPQNQ